MGHDANLQRFEGNRGCSLSWHSFAFETCSIGRPIGGPTIGGGRAGHR